MNSKNLLHLFGCLLLLSSLSPAGAQQPPPQPQPQTIMADGFDYTGWSTGAAPMNGVWLVNTGTAPSIVTNNPTLSSSFISLNNGVIDANLSQTMTTGWTVTIDVSNTSYQRGQWVGVFNAAGTQGYGFVWDTNLATMAGSQGTVWITKFNVTDPSSLIFNVRTGVTQLTTPMQSGHNASNTTGAAISPPFAHFQLNWIAETNTLTLSVDGVQVATCTDTSSPYTTFSRVFLSGNTSGLFDNFSIKPLAPAPGVPHATPVPSVPSPSK